MRLSIVLCTRDRAPSLRGCLASVDAAAMREAGAELVVVDNGSRDDTKAIVRAFAQAAPFPVLRVHEPKPGRSRARNAGIAAARGQVLAFTDDDCRLAADHPLRAASLFVDSPARFGGGRVLPGDPADAHYGYVQRRRARWFAPGTCFSPGALLGSNLVVHREVVDVIGAFDEMIGPGTPFRANDIDYLQRASLAGFTGVYWPELVVHHHHGRRPGPDLAALQAADDFARGAYYAKFLALGCAGMRLRRFCSWLAPWRVGRILRECRGAAAFRAACRASGSEPQLRLPVPRGDVVPNELLQV